MLNKLEAKGYSAELIKGIIEELKCENWQSDKRFAESYIRNRIHSGYGPVKINYELRQRGIEKADYEHIVAELAGSWTELIEQVYKHKYTDSRNLTRKEWVKRTRFLQQRGFTIEVIGSLFGLLNIKLS